MNGDEYTLSDEQKAAMQETRDLLGNDASAALAHQELMRTKPDLFKNTGHDAHLVMYNWAGFVAPPLPSPPPA